MAATPKKLGEEK